MITLLRPGPSRPDATHYQIKDRCGVSIDNAA